jgi:hypothetical protein
VRLALHNYKLQRVYSGVNKFQQTVKYSFKVISHGASLTSFCIIKYRGTLFSEGNYKMGSKNNTGRKTNNEATRGVRKIGGSSLNCCLYGGVVTTQTAWVARAPDPTFLN